MSKIIYLTVLVICLTLKMLDSQCDSITAMLSENFPGSVPSAEVCHMVIDLFICVACN